jgi:hypothetical protein
MISCPKERETAIFMDILQENKNVDKSSNIYFIMFLTLKIE